MHTSEQKSARLDLRLSLTNKEVLEQAASLTGQTLSEFVVASTLRTARKIMIEQERLVLTDRERNLFMKALDDTTPPNKALRDAAKRFNAHYKK
jgi:uncharacterized protein (DUF1778 family)